MQHRHCLIFPTLCLWLGWEPTLSLLSLAPGTPSNEVSVSRARRPVEDMSCLTSTQVPTISAPPPGKQARSFQVCCVSWISSPFPSTPDCVVTFHLLVQWISCWREHSLGTNNVGWCNSITVCVCVWGGERLGCVQISTNQVFDVIGEEPSFCKSCVRKEPVQGTQLHASVVLGEPGWSLRASQSPMASRTGESRSRPTEFWVPTTPRSSGSPKSQSRKFSDFH